MECPSVSLLLLALLVLNVIGIEGRINKRRSGDSDLITFGDDGSDNESLNESDELSERWGKKPGGWQKGVPSCGRPGQPPCQDGSNGKPGSTGKPGQNVSPGSNGKPGSSGTPTPAPGSNGNPGSNGTPTPAPGSKGNPGSNGTPTPAPGSNGKPGSTSGQNTPKPTESSVPRETRPTFATTAEPPKTKPVDPIGLGGNQKPIKPPTQGPNEGQKPTPTPPQGPNEGQKPTPTPPQGPNEGQKPTPTPPQGPNEGQKPTPTPPQGPNEGQKPTPTPPQGPNEGQKPTPTPPQGPNEGQKPTPTPPQGPNEGQKPTPTPPQGPNEGQRPTPPPTQGPSTPEDKHEIDKCMRKCPLTAEDEPVCGNNGVTYINPWHFNCAQKCRIAVTTFSRGACPPKCDPNGSSSAIIRECIRNCPVTSEHDPICGTNGVTYNNYGRLLCAKKCGVAVDMRSKGSCQGNVPVTEFADDENTGATPSTPSSNAIIRCMGNCPVTSEYNPVCGSDGVTYTNPGRLTCAKDCGANVVLLSKGACRPTPPSTEITIIRTTPPDALTRACISRCPTTGEYNPVCGTDLVTYNNPGRLYCAQSCGSEVQVLRRGPCSGKNVVDPPIADTKDPVTPPVVIVTPSNPVTPNTTPSSVARACMEKCPSTNEYNPVCGTNYVSYQNAGKLFCAQRCGIDVQQLRQGNCPARPTTPVTPVTTTTVRTPITTAAGSSTTQSAGMRRCIIRCPKTPEYNPVCGTDLVTYNNPSHLTCAQNCGASVTMLRHGPCPKTPITTSTEPMTTWAWRWE
ncbi:hypothetical protein NE865_11035 [Phthorimaea operculella]|nr:hypothetical protein NE865_11035 [Phthorimaea operculella]